MTVPDVRAAIVESITDLERLRLSVGSGPLFAVMSWEKAKLSYRWMPAVIQRWATSRGRLLRDEETGEPFRVPCCPDCAAQIVDKDGVPLTDADLNRRKHASLGPNSWPSRSSRKAARASPVPHPSQCSSGRWSRNGRGSRSARGARPPTQQGEDTRISVSSPCESICEPDAPIDVKECCGIGLSSVGRRRLRERHSV